MEDMKTKADELKQEGNIEYKDKNYIKAKELYTKAIGNIKLEK